jgi:RNA polymerase sigma factor (sigma-70 family)
MGLLGVPLVVTASNRRPPISVHSEHPSPGAVKHRVSGAVGSYSCSTDRYMEGKSVARHDTLGARLAQDLDTWFPELVRSEVDAVYSALYRVGGRGADAEDITQETFLKAYSALGGYTSKRIVGLRLRPWLLTIALNLWRNELRRRSRNPVASERDSIASDVDNDDPEDHAVQSADRRELAAMLAELPEIYRVPIVLRHVVGLSTMEVAKTLDRPTGTVKAQVARGVSLLRGLMQEQQLEEAQ